MEYLSAIDSSNTDIAPVRIEKTLTAYKIKIILMVKSSQVSIHPTSLIRVARGETPYLDWILRAARCSVRNFVTV